MKNLRILEFGLMIMVGFSSVLNAISNQTVQEELSTLKENWKRQVNELKNTKAFYSMQATVLKRLLNSSSSNLVEAEFQRVCKRDIADSAKEPKDLNQSYDAVLVEALVAHCILQRNRPRLVELLRHNCPSQLEHMQPLEFGLEAEWPGSIQVLFESYKKSNSNLAKTTILKCLGQAFGTLRAQHTANEAFLTAAEKWYWEHRSKLKINRKYPYLSARQLTPHESPSNDLFVFE